VADVIADCKKTPGAVGIRIIMTKESKRALDDPDFDRILRAAVRNDFPVNILFWGNIDAGTALIDRHSDVRLRMRGTSARTKPSAKPARMRRKKERSVDRLMGSDGRSWRLWRRQPLGQLRMRLLPYCAAIDSVSCRRRDRS
jgi:hypothetical protein